MTEDQLSDKTLSEIRFISEVAKANQSHISLREIALLTSIGFTETELRDKWDTIPELRRYNLEQDLLLDPDLGVPEDSNSAIANATKTKARAEEYVRCAKAFFAWSKETSARIVSISGSTSYLSPRPNDDLDFFAVSARDSLWIFLFKSLLLARAFRLFHPRSPRMCFSYVADETFAEKAFATKDPLLARDALSVIVLRGENYYRKLVRQNKWISNYFPKLYKLRTEDAQADTKELAATGPSMLRRSLNLLLFICLGRYIRIKSSLLNMRYLSHGKTWSLFTVESGPDHCIFASARYSRLRRMYNLAFPETWRDGRSLVQG